jgi:uncharacterized protein with PQ loop repeat
MAWPSVLFDSLPIIAAGFAIPQFIPQILKLRRSDDGAGVSWSWAALTSVNNAAWFVYFAATENRLALVPATSAALLAGTCAVILARLGLATRMSAAVIAMWTGFLAVAYVTTGAGGLGTVLVVAFVLQVTPSVWSAFTTEHPTGVATGTWQLILGELSCWAAYGVHVSDPRLIGLGTTGIVASLLMLARARIARIASQAAVSRS